MVDRKDRTSRAPKSRRPWERAPATRVREDDMMTEAMRLYRCAADKYANALRELAK